MIDTIQRVKLRDVWKHEAEDFTVWLENKIDVINECVGLNLGSVRRKKTLEISAWIWLQKMKAEIWLSSKTNSKKVTTIIWASSSLTSQCLKPKQQFGLLASRARNICELLHG